MLPSELQIKILTFVPLKDLMNAIIGSALLSQAPAGERAGLSSVLVLDIMASKILDGLCTQDHTKRLALLRIAQRLALCFNLTVPTNPLQAARACLAWMQRLQDEVWLDSRIPARAPDPFESADLGKRTQELRRTGRALVALLPMAMPRMPFNVVAFPPNVVSQTQHVPAHRHPLATLLSLLFRGSNHHPQSGFLAAALFLGAPIEILNTIAHLEEIHTPLGADEPFVWACRGLNIAGLHWLMQRGVQAANSRLLHQLWSEGHHAMLPILLDYGANPQQQEANHKMFFHTVCEHGDLDTAKMLLERGANPNAVCYFNRTPLHAACVSGQKELVELLLRYKATVNVRDEMDRTPLHLACGTGDAQMVNLLLQQGADVTALEESGKTALHWALTTNAIAETAQIISALLERNRDIINIVSNTYETALRLACTAHPLKIIQLLLQYGATPSPTALMEACKKSSNVEVIEYLFNQQLLKIQDSESRRTPLHWVCLVGDLASIQCVLGHQPDLNAVDAAGDTALHLACIKGHVAAVKVLLEAGASLSSRNVKNETPLQYACRKPHLCVVALIIEYRDRLGAEWDTIALQAIQKTSDTQAQSLLQQSLSVPELAHTVMMQIQKDREESQRKAREESQRLSTLLQQYRRPGGS